MKSIEQGPVAVFDEKLGRPKMLANAPILIHGQKLYTTPPQTKEQEPVACPKCKGLGRIYMGCDSWIHCDVCNTTGKYTPPQRTWVGLTDEEIDYLVQSTPYEDEHLLVQKTEALLKEKNT